MKDMTVFLEKYLFFFILFMSFIVSVEIKAAAICQLDRIDAKVKVRHVIDGDTITLKDERNVRIIGMNTPEVGHGKGPSEDFGEAARLRLIQLLSKFDNHVKLRYGKDKFDRHGRMLAHVFAGNENVTEYMLRQGLAVQITVPPNVWQRQCYRHAEDEARLKNRRIWQLPIYQYQPLSRLPRSAGGFHLIQGNVTQVNMRGRQWKIEVSDRLTLSVGKKYRRYFNKKKLSGLLGKRVFVRGWIRNREKHFYIGLKHPDMVKVYPVGCTRLSCQASSARPLQ